MSDQEPHAMRERINGLLETSTAYDLAQAAIHKRIEALETCVVQTSGSLTKALQRIEKLETDIKLDRGEAIKSEKRIEDLEHALDMASANLSGRLRVLERAPDRPDQTEGAATVDIKWDKPISEEESERRFGKRKPPAGLYPTTTVETVDWKPFKFTDAKVFEMALTRAKTELDNAQSCIDQCKGLKWTWAEKLDPVEVAVWMWKNPTRCAGAFALEVLQESIGPREENP